MSALKMAVTVITRNGKNPVSCSGVFKQNLETKSLFSAATSRGICSQNISKSITYISQDKIKLEVDPKNLQLSKPLERPLCVMINWMLARPKHVMKYATIYMEQGFDVLSVSCTPWQLLWPLKGSQLVAADLLKFMESNKSFAPLTVHGFSVGGYMWGEVCLHASKDKPRFQPVLDRVVAQVWDSVPDVSEFTVGLPRAVFPRNKVMQNALHKYVAYHLKTFHEAATVHYMRSSHMFHRNMCPAPALFLLSKTDPVGTENTNRRLRDSWESLGIKTTWKCWDRSAHVQHFMKHPKEYVAALYDHLDAEGLVKQPEKIRMRL